MNVDELKRKLNAIPLHKWDMPVKVEIKDDKGSWLMPVKTVKQTADRELVIIPKPYEEAALEQCDDARLNDNATN